MQRSVETIVACAAFLQNLTLLPHSSQCVFVRLQVAVSEASPISKHICSVKTGITQKRGSSLNTASNIGEQHSTSISLSSRFVLPLVLQAEPPAVAVASAAVAAAASVAAVVSVVVAAVDSRRCVSLGYLVSVERCCSGRAWVRLRPPPPWPRARPGPVPGPRLRRLISPLNVAPAHHRV